MTGEENECPVRVGPQLVEKGVELMARGDVVDHGLAGDGHVSGECRTVYQRRATCTTCWS